MTNKDNKKDYSKLVQDLPRPGETIEGEVLEIGRNEIYLDLNGIATGIIRGPELFDESGEFSNLKKGDKTIATVVDLENEKGLVELSFRQASHKKAWSQLEGLFQKQETISVKVTDANRGGLLILNGKVKGFLPVSRLKPDHYPRVEAGDKNKILEHLKQFVGQELMVKIINVDEKDDKLIVSEKEVLSEGNKNLQKKYKVGDIVDGKISGIVDFGIFVTFDDNQEGLAHISELAWQRIDHPKDLFKTGDKVKAEIIGITNDQKVSLSVRNLMEDPWANVQKEYRVGQQVTGKVLQVNHFGLFVELDSKIHGLAHISELSDKAIKDINEIARPGDELRFTIVSIEPKDHRLGLSLKANPTKSVKTKQIKEEKIKADKTKEKKGKEKKKVVKKTEKNKKEDKDKREDKADKTKEKKKVVKKTEQNKKEDKKNKEK